MWKSEGKKQFSTIAVENRYATMIAAPPSLPKVINDVREFVADNRPVAAIAAMGV
jgi:hypothetical protein